MVSSHGQERLSTIPLHDIPTYTYLLWSFARDESPLKYLLEKQRNYVKIHALWRMLWFIHICYVPR